MLFLRRYELYGFIWLLAEFFSLLFVYCTKVFSYNRASALTLLLSVRSWVDAEVGKVDEKLTLAPPSSAPSAHKSVLS